MSINKAALDQASAARKRYRADTPVSLYSIEGEDAVFIAAYLEAIKGDGQPVECSANIEIMTISIEEMDKLYNDPLTKTVVGIPVYGDDRGHLWPSPATEWESKVVSALQRLVELKRYKDKYGKDARYETQQPLAWEEAIAALNQIEGESHG